MSENLKLFSTPAETARQFGDYLVKQIERAKGTYHCALSGGSTPRLLFDYLGAEYPQADFWQRVHFYWGDERCVPPDHAESNYKMTVDHLLSKIGIPAENVHRIRGENDPETEAERYADELSQYVPTSGAQPVFDMIILGMGEDGHTASIFPHQMKLLNADGVCAVATHPQSGQKRVTLTGQVINRAREVAFLVTGAGKKQKVQEILRQTGDWQDYPAAHIRPMDGTLYWFLDEAAGELL